MEAVKGVEAGGSGERGWKLVEAVKAVKGVEAGGSWWKLVEAVLCYFIMIKSGCGVVRGRNPARRF